MRCQSPLDIVISKDLPYRQVTMPMITSKRYATPRSVWQGQWKMNDLDIFYLAFGQLREVINKNTNELKFIMMNATPRSKYSMKRDKGEQRKTKEDKDL